MVRLVPAGVEDGHDTIAGELLDDAPCGIDGRHDDGPVLIEHRDHHGRFTRLAERGEGREVGEQDTDDALLPAQSCAGRFLADLLGHHGWQVRPERGVEPA